MKKITALSLIITSLITFSCNGPRRNPGRIYMPDMAYSRAYETYSDYSNLKEENINYNNMPVAGTVARGEEMPFPFPKDKTGDSVNYVASKQYANPLDSSNGQELKEAERIYLINCAICHGTKLDGNGPLYNGGNGPFPAKPATLVGDVKYEVMPEGQMFYSVTYGKNLMGPYSSQLNRHQRWMVVRYIKTRQKAGKPATPSAANDSSAMAKK